MPSDVVNTAVPATIQALAAAPAEVNWGVAYLVIFPTAIGYLTWAIALKRLTAARASNFLYGVPPVATLIGFVWLGETPTGARRNRRRHGNLRRAGRQRHAEAVASNSGGEGGLITVRHCAAVRFL